MYIGIIHNYVTFKTNVAATATTIPPKTIRLSGVACEILRHFFFSAGSALLRFEMNAEGDLYDAKLLPPDTDPSTSITESIESPVIKFPSAKDAENTEKDGGWAWIVCGAAFCDLFVVLGMHYTVGVLYAALLDHFKESKAKTGKKYQWSLFAIVVKFDNM